MSAALYAMLASQQRANVMLVRFVRVANVASVAIADVRAAAKKLAPEDRKAIHAAIAALEHELEVVSEGE